MALKRPYILWFIRHFEITLCEHLRHPTTAYIEQIWRSPLRLIYTLVRSCTSLRRRWSPLKQVWWSATEGEERDGQTVYTGCKGGRKFLSAPWWSGEKYFNGMARGRNRCWPCPCVLEGPQAPHHPHLAFSLSLRGHSSLSCHCVSPIRRPRSLCELLKCIIVAYLVRTLPIMPFDIFIISNLGKF